MLGGGEGDTAEPDPSLFAGLVVQAANHALLCVQPCTACVFGKSSYKYRKAATTADKEIDSHSEMIAVIERAQSRTNTQQEHKVGESHASRTNTHVSTAPHATPSVRAQVVGHQFITGYEYCSPRSSTGSLLLHGRSSTGWKIKQNKHDFN